MTLLVTRKWDLTETQGLGLGLRLGFDRDLILRGLVGGGREKANNSIRSQAVLYSNRAPLVT